MNSKFAFNSIDKILLMIISPFLTASFLFWLISNVLRTNLLLIWIAVLPVSVTVSFLALKHYHFQTVRLSRTSVLPYLLLFFWLLVSLLFLLEPIISHPYHAIGIPNKDVHDGMAVFIQLHGYPPQDYATEENMFVPRSQNDLFLGYPNVLHASAAFLNKLGVFVFHSTWLVVVIGLLITSLSIFLISKTVSNNLFYSATIAGLFALSSIRISYTAFTSIVMLYSYTLILPTLLICLLALYNKKHDLAYVLPAIGLALVTASYGGTILIFAPLLLAFCLFTYLRKDKQIMGNFGKLVLLSTPLILIALLFQRQYYWQSLLTVAQLYDPNEPSQKLVLADQPLYMIFLGMSLIVVWRSFFQNRLTGLVSTLKLYLFLINLVFLALIPYDWLFNHLNQIQSSSQLAEVPVEGLFGSLIYMNLSRVVLLGPFFFIFFLADLSLLFKHKIFQLILVVLIIALGFFIRIDLPLYQWLSWEIKAHFYNPQDRDKPITLLSDMRLFVNDRMWSKEILEAFDYLKRQPDIGNNILVWNDYDPFVWERALVGWGSVYLTQKIFRRSELTPFTEKIDSNLLKLFQEKKIRYLLILYPRDSNLISLKTAENTREVWQKNGILIFYLDTF